MESSKVNEEINGGGGGGVRGGHLHTQRITNFGTTAVSPIASSAVFKDLKEESGINFLLRSACIGHLNEK